MTDRMLGYTILWGLMAAWIFGLADPATLPGRDPGLALRDFSIGFGMAILALEATLWIMKGVWRLARRATVRRRRKTPARVKTVRGVSASVIRQGPSDPRRSPESVFLAGFDQVDISALAGAMVACNIRQSSSLERGLAAVVFDRKLTDAAGSGSELVLRATRLRAEAEMLDIPVISRTTFETCLRRLQQGPRLEWCLAPLS